MYRCGHYNGHFLLLFSKSKAEVSNSLPIIKDSDKSSREKIKLHQLRNNRTRQAFVCVVDTT